MKTKKFKLFVFIMAFFIITFSFTIPNAKADEEGLTDCPICSGDESTYPMEHQFYERIKAFKKQYGNKIDEVALAATVLHRENFYQAAKARYNKNYKESSFIDSIKSFFSSGSAESKDESEKVGMTDTQMDKLTAAAMVMADSASGGRYNEDKYKEALASEEFLKNDPLKREIMCTTAKLFAGDGTDTSDEAIKWTNRKNICDYGYVGAVYGLTEIEDDNVRHIREEQSAQEIIDFIHYYYKLTNKKRDMCAIATSGDFTSWKQADPEWGSIPIGPSNIANIGCLVTSTAIQMARSGTAIANLPSGYSVFNPGAFVTTLNNNNGFTLEGGFKWSGFGSIAGNWRIGQTVNVSTSNNATLAKRILSELSTAAEDKYQKFLVLQIHHNTSSEHWVAVDSVSGNTVTIFDPGGPTGNTLDDNYSGWVVDNYKVMYATDVEFGKIGTSTSGIDKCEGDLLHQVMDAIRHGEGSATCNYKGRGEDTGYVAYRDKADEVDVGMSTGYGFTEYYTKNYADEVGYTTFIEDLHNKCTDKEYVDKMAEKKFGGDIEYIKELWDENANGKQLKANQYVALIYKKNHWPAIMPTLISELAAVDPYSYEAFAVFMTYHGLPNHICGGYNGAELMYHIWYNGNYDAVRYYPCSQFSREFWQERVEFYKSENIS